MARKRASVFNMTEINKRMSFTNYIAGSARWCAYSAETFQALSSRFAYSISFLSSEALSAEKRRDENKENEEREIPAFLHAIFVSLNVCKTFPGLFSSLFLNVHICNKTN